MNDDTLVVRRLIKTSREKVFAAWLDPEGMKEWMKPGDVHTVAVELDPRVGGRFRIVMEHGRGDAEHWGEYLVIDPPSLLQFTWISGSTDFQPSVVTIELFDRDGSTELVLTHRRLPLSKVEPHRNGWGTIVEKLSAALTR